MKKRNKVEHRLYKGESTQSDSDAALSTESDPLFNLASTDQNLFKFPAPPLAPYNPPPKHHYFSQLSDSSSTCSYDNDSEENIYPARPYSAAKVATSSVLASQLPPVGVFWDIENIQIPKAKSAMAVVQKIRDRFFSGHREAEFLCVCDVTKENGAIIKELNDAQVNVVHVSATSKNAADEKLRQSMRRFADTHSPPATVILISSDINFVPDLSDLRHRKKLHVISVHLPHVPEALVLCCNEHYEFQKIVEGLPPRKTSPQKANTRQVEILVTNLPEKIDAARVSSRLRQLSDNCGGRVVTTIGKNALIRFTSKELAHRAKKRMDGEDVFGNKISISYPSKILPPTGHDNASRNYFARRNFKNRREEETDVGIGSYSSDGGYGVGTLSLRRDGCVPGGTDTQNGWKSHHFQQQYKQSRGIISDPRDAAQLKRNDGGNYSDSNLPHSEQTPEGYRRIKGAHKVSYRSDDGGGSISYPTTKRRSESTSNGNASYFHGKSTFNYFRTCRTPSPAPSYLASEHSFNRSNSQGPPGQQQYKLHPSSPSNPYNFHSNADNGNKEISRKSLSPNPSSALLLIPPDLSVNPVELQITNLDQSIDAKEMKCILFSLFSEHVMVLHVSVFVQSDGNLAATVKVPSPQDAQFAISQLHRVKIGFKRIVISYANTGSPNFQMLKSQMIALLLEVPGRRLPLFKFRELLESRFHCSVSVSDIYKMKDAITVTDEVTGRMVGLSPEYRNTPSPISSTASQEIEPAYCSLHCPPRGNLCDRGWAEQDEEALPNVLIGLEAFSVKIHSLLQGHQGTLPLLSLPWCYRAEFGELEIEENGVPLEHLVSCVPGVQLTVVDSRLKMLEWQKSKLGVDLQPNLEDIARSVSPRLAGQLELFSREVVDLLKTTPCCRLAFNRFVPAYHHHFGRQCRVADYGFTKLADLFDALPGVVQVMGEGNKRTITLAHKAQIRRFTSELLRVLKSQASKQFMLSELPALYQKVMNRTFNIVDFGVCEISDMLTEVSENTVLVTSSGPDKLIAIPKREQTPEEIERTAQFAAETLELLRHAPQCSMLFNKFIPAYHHHFGRQCRVADYGFTKLIELFEAIPDIVKVVEGEDGGERCVVLAIEQRLRVLSDQVAAFVRSSRKQTLPLSSLGPLFLHQHGHPLKPEHYECSSIEEVVKSLKSVMILQTSTGPVITLVDRGYHLQYSIQVKKILGEQPDFQMPLTDLLVAYQKHFGQSLLVETLQKELADVVQVKGNTGTGHLVSLAPLHKFSCEVQQLLRHQGGSLPLNKFDEAFVEHFGRPCRPAQLGFSSLGSLLQAVSESAVVRGRGHKKVILLNRDSSAVNGGGLKQGKELDNGVTSTQDITDKNSALENGHVSQETSNFGSREKESTWPPLENSSSNFLRSIFSDKAPTMNGASTCGTPPPAACSGYGTSNSGATYAGVTQFSGHQLVWGQVWGGPLPPSPASSVYPTYFPPHGMSGYVVPPVALPWPPFSSPPSGIVSSPLRVIPPLAPDSPPLARLSSGSQVDDFSSPEYRIPLAPPGTRVVPPDPSELPMPSLSLCSPSSVNMNNASILEESLETCSNDSGSALASSGKRKPRIAAHFSNPMQLP